MLWRIANGRKLSFTALLEHADDIEVVDHRAITPLLEDKGRYISYPLFPFDETTRFETYRIVMKLEAFLQAEGHILGTVEFVTVFLGGIRIEANGETYTLTRGDAIRFRADTPHSYRNIGAETAELSMTIDFAP